jgi:hypothetical protein
MLARAPVAALEGELRFIRAPPLRSPFEFKIGSGVITGWSDGVATMAAGERAVFVIAADKAYGVSRGC